MKIGATVLIIIGLLLMVANLILNIFEHETTGLLLGGVALVIAGFSLLRSIKRKKKIQDNKKGDI